MLLLLCIMLDSDPHRRGRTSVCRRITPFSGSADQCEIRDVDVCVFTEWAKTPSLASVTQSPYASLPVLGPDTALV